MKNEAKSIVFYGLGDTWLNRPEPQTATELIGSELDAAQIKFAALKGCLSEKTYTPQIFLRVGLLAHPRNFEPLKKLGFDVISFASNHCLDYGYDPFLSTIELLSQNGIKVIGAGQNLSTASKPAIIEKEGITVAFLSYNCTLPPGYAADLDKPGTVPMKIYTMTEMIEAEQPGTAVRIHSFANKNDLEKMQNAITALKKQVNTVIINFHWGIHFTTGTLAEYQSELAHCAIDAGADMILGTHQHILKGIEVYKGKVIFYSLNNFAFDFSVDLQNLSAGVKELMDTYNWKVDPDWASTYAFPEESRKSLVAAACISASGIEEVWFLPMIINRQAQPRILRHHEVEYNEVAKYVENISRMAGFMTEFYSNGDRIMINIK